MKVEKYQNVKKYDHNGKELGIRFGLGGIKAVGIGIMEDLVENRQQDGEFKDIYDFASRLGTKIVSKKSIEALSKSGSFDNIHPSRNQIVESCEILCKYAASEEVEKKSNQMSLFGTGGKIDDKKPALKTVDDWNKEERLQNEFRAFGFFVGEHPIDDFAEKLQKRGITFSDELDSYEIDDGDTIKLAGVVAYSRHRSGPKGRYAYLILSDPVGIFETSIFDEELITNSRDLMADGNNLVVETLVRKDEGGTRLLVRSMMALDDFIKITKEGSPKKKKSRRGGWKRDDKNEDDSYAILVERRNQELRNKESIPEVTIDLAGRDAVLNIKGFLSQKALPENLSIPNVTKVFLICDGARIELPNGYLIDKNDVEKINLIAGCKVI
jgi:DNA polymerase III alpha subunit